MEYYWSDFMNICDDLGPHSKVNLGEEHVFGIPETLHFVATINNDHTTETLSPRLIDRAWVITLPQLTLRDYSSSVSEAKIPAEIMRSFHGLPFETHLFPKGRVYLYPRNSKCYDSIIVKLREKNFSVSPRINAAIKQYWTAASSILKWMTQKTAAATIALDYAVAQRILPKDHW